MARLARFSIAIALIGWCVGATWPTAALADDVRVRGRIAGYPFARQTCEPACNRLDMDWNGNWTNSDNHGVCGCKPRDPGH